MIRVDEYLADNGRNYYQEWFNGLATPAAAKAATAIARMAAGKRPDTPRDLVPHGSKE